ncbi:MAG: glycosyltransferase [Dysgonamonadaceae bacterium]|jgi:glycosyltransferase involved in cell wall biosynthesis|nr:glycosyltransferase [Dysgonamonadaceae bacterium]
MKILLANKFYYRRGGAEVYVINLENLLRKHGHEVAVFAMQHSENLPSAYEKYFPKEVDFTHVKFRDFFTSVSRPLGSKEVTDKFSRLLEEFRPDVIHLNNIHSQLSPVIAKIAHKKGIKTVWTLHDYKMLCPRYDCLCRGSDICEKCFTDKKQVIKNRCMKNSFAASNIAYWEAVKWNRQILEKYTDTFICPSRFMYDKMIAGAFCPSKLRILNNGIDISATKLSDYNIKEDYCCYLGRISNEKGIETLINAVKQLPYQLKIIGGGPLKENLEAKANKHLNIDFAGYKQWDEIKNIVSKARFTITPSEWYENCPISIIESLCLGTPVLGARIGGIPELIEENANGLLFESGNECDLKNKIQKMFATNFDYREIAEKSQVRYSGENHYNELLKIYKQLI